MAPLLAAALVLSLALGDQARGAYDPVGSGATTIALAPQFSATLAQHGVKVRVYDGRRQGGGITLPAAGGEVDPHLGAGTVESEGTIVLSAGSRKVVLSQIEFAAKRAPLYAKVGGGQLKLGTGARITATRDGFGARFSATGVRLSAKLASRLDKKLRLGRALTAGDAFVDVSVRVQPATVHLQPRGRLYLSLDSSFASKLDQLFVSLNPIAPAELAAGPTLSFPVGLESTLAVDGSSGTVKLEGQAELLQLGHAQMFWRELWWEAGLAALLAETDSEPAPPQAGVAPQAPLLATVPGGTVSSDPGLRTISVSGRALALSAATAAALNAAFSGEGKPTFAAGEAIGSLSLQVTAE
jgi:hypothetical protein